MSPSTSSRTPATVLSDRATDAPEQATVPDEAATSLEAVVAQEIGLLDPRMRRDGDAIAALLHPDFVELSPTGHTYDRDTVLVPTAEDTIEGMTAEQLTAELLAPGVALVTYRSHRGERVAWRCSVWVHTDRGWLLRHHQATPIRGVISPA